MTRNKALEIAKMNYAAHTKATINHMFKDGPAFDEVQDFGFRYGWYRVGEFCFCNEEITGQPYDHTQRGWAFI